jgi:MFS family permease
VNLPLGIAALIVLLVFMPSLRFAKPGTQIDYLGAGVLIAGLVPLLLAFSWGGSTYPWSSPQVVGLLIWSVLDLTVFILIEMRRDYAVVEPALFRVRIYSTSILITTLMGAAMFGGIFYIPLFVQGVLGSSATNSGVITTPLMMALVAGSILSGQLLSRFGRYKFLAVSGMVIMVAGTLLMLRLIVSSHYSDVLLAMIVMGFGLGLGLQLYTTVSQNAVTQSKIGQATSALIFFRQLGATVGLALMGSLLTARFRSHLAGGMSPELRRLIPAPVRQRFDNPQVLVSPAARAAMRNSFAHFGSRGLALYQELQQDIKVALANGLHDVFLGALILVVVALIGTLYLPEIPLRTAAGQESSEEEPAQPAVAVAGT